MAVYEYRCTTCGPMSLTGSVHAPTPAAPACRGCGEPTRRVFSAPRLRAVAPALSRARDAADSSAHAPIVTRALPAAAPRTRTGGQGGHGGHGGAGHPGGGNPRLYRQRPGSVPLPRT